MRHVGEQPTLGGDQRIDSLRHAVEIAAKLGEFVMTAGNALIHSRVEMLIGDLASGNAELADGARDMAGEPKAKDRRRGKHGYQADKAFRAQILEQELSHRTRHKRVRGKRHYERIGVDARPG